jgi:hypothetical protein
LSSEKEESTWRIYPEGVVRAASTPLKNHLDCGKAEQRESLGRKNKGDAGDGGTGEGGKGQSREGEEPMQQVTEKPGQKHKEQWGSLEEKDGRGRVRKDLYGDGRKAKRKNGDWRLG